MPEQKPKEESKDCAELRRAIREVGGDDDMQTYAVADACLKFAADFALRNSVSSLGHKLEALRTELQER